MKIYYPSSNYTRTCISYSAFQIYNLTSELKDCRDVACNVPTLIFTSFKILDSNSLYVATLVFQIQWISMRKFARFYY